MNDFPRLDWGEAPNYVARDLRSGMSMPSGPESRRDELARRSQELEAKLAARRPARNEADNAPGSVGYGQAFKLSSEFIAGIAVGVGIGWILDTTAGTSPWGLIIFLLLGFVAGVLNVLRSAGLIAQPGSSSARNGTDGPDRN